MMTKAKDPSRILKQKTTSMPGTNESLSLLQSLMRVYRVEPMGLLLRGRLQVPIGILWLVMLVLKYMHIAALHDISRDPIEIFPDLIAALNPFLLIYEIVGTPLIWSMLFYFRETIPARFQQLDNDGMLVQKAANGPARVLRQIGGNAVFQILATVIFPCVAGLLSAFTNAARSLFYFTGPLAFVGGYTLAIVIVQLAYAIFIRANYNLKVTLQVEHPDKCSGLKPFGDLAVCIYSFLFTFAMMMAVLGVAGGSALERVVSSLTRINTLYLWLFFPVGLLIVFDQFVYGPHHALELIRYRYLKDSVDKLTKYREGLVDRISLSALAVPFNSQKSKDDAAGFKEEFETLEIWRKLNGPVVEMHTWPISKQTFGIFTILLNPVFPALTNLVLGWLGIK